MSALVFCILSLPRILAKADKRAYVRIQMAYATREAFKASYDSFDEALSDLPVAQYRTNEGFKSWLKAMAHEYRFHLQHIKKAQRL